MLTTTWAALALFVSVVPAKVLHTSSRWILDEDNARHKLRCVNWAGHMETNTPEGLQHQTVDSIASWIANAGFNCVRLTYSIDMALAQDVPVADSFYQSAAAANVPLDAVTALYNQAVKKNPFLATATRKDVFASVIKALGAHGVDVILDNHVSRAQWCCDLDDGNGWWDEAAGYNALTARYFNTQNWLNGLAAMATFARDFDNVVGMSLRNELRSLPPQNLNGAADWYDFMAQGAGRIHTANPKLLIMMGGVNGALDLSFLRVNTFDRTPYDDKVVWEYHIYSYSPGYITSNCDIFKAEMGAASGYLLEQNKDFTGPLWFSEFGFGMVGGANTGLNDQDLKYLTCLTGYLANNDADWAVWALQGDYYIRQGRVSVDESYGVLKRDWSDYRNPQLKTLLAPIWNATQGP